jgi:hypothetical protein
VSALTSWIGKPWTKHDNEEYQRGYHRLQAGFLDRNMLRSGEFEKAEARYKRLEWRKRVYRRLAVIAILAGVAVAAGSAYSDNRALDAIGRSLGALIGGLALLTFAVTRTKET